jgi:hypothetical protein
LATWNPNAITLRGNIASSSRLTSIFVNLNDTIYVTDSQTTEILVWLNDDVSPTSIILENFWGPNSIFVTINGDIYVDDGDGRHNVFKWTSNTKPFIPAMSVTSSCHGLFVDINNTIYCSMYCEHRVVKQWLCSNATNPTTIAGTGVSDDTSKTLSNPRGIFVDINLDLYVADSGNNRIQLFRSGELNGTTVAGGSSSATTITLVEPTGVVLDADKYLFIVDYGNNRIVGSGSEGFRCIAGCSKSAGSKSNELNQPWSLSFDSHGNIFVTDWWNGRIQKFLLSTNSCSKYDYASLWNIKRNWRVIKSLLTFYIFLESCNFS